MIGRYIPTYYTYRIYFILYQVIVYYMLCVRVRYCNAKTTETCDDANGRLVSV